MSDVLEKWGRPVAERGFAQIPTYLLNLNRFLDEEHRLTPIELLVLFQLVGNWWKKDEDPFPSMATLASRCGVSTRQVQRAINNLDKLELVSRVKRQKRRMITSNAYSLQPLVEFLTEIAKAFPNEYPRRVTKEDRRLLSSKIGSSNELDET
ncbi:MAG TPA: helix-turn-helix domain-containing protein [Terriglobales bacterium]|nr:helix-turn-helix domain-containing protein [Terriglobales bacterium]